MNLIEIQNETYYNKIIGPLEDIAKNKEFYFLIITFFLNYVTVYDDERCDLFVAQFYFTAI